MGARKLLRSTLYPLDHRFLFAQRYRSEGNDRAHTMKCLIRTVKLITIACVPGELNRKTAKGKPAALSGAIQRFLTLTITYSLIVYERADVYRAVLVPTAALI